MQCCGKKTRHRKSELQPLVLISIIVNSNVVVSNSDTESILSPVMCLSCHSHVYTYMSVGLASIYIDLVCLGGEGSSLKSLQLP